MKKQTMLHSFINAAQGVIHAARKERNFKIHIAFAIVAAAICIILPVDTIYRFMVMYAIFFVLCTELINTAVEAVVDLHCGQNINPLAKIAKDCCAGAVLLASIQAVFVAIIVARHIFSIL